MSEPSSGYNSTLESLTMQRDELRRRVASDRDRREQEKHEAYRRGYAAGFHAARRQDAPLAFQQPQRAT